MDEKKREALASTKMLAFVLLFLVTLVLIGFVIYNLDNILETLHSWTDASNFIISP